MTYRAAMDIGGTFTDFVVVDEERQATLTGKTSTTPASPEDGVLEGLSQVVPDPTAISFVVHGTTVGLNAFLERKGTRVLLVMTNGLRDAYSIARHDRKELYTLRYRKPDRLVPRHDVYEVVERLRYDGSVDTDFDEASLGRVIDAVRRDGIEAVAVCLVHSYVNPDHELRVREVLERECPGLSVTLSHELAREWREYERASTAVLNAYVAPRVERYLRNLEDGLSKLRVDARLHVMQSNGGITTAAKARREPIQTLLSGPVGGTIGGAALSRLTGRPNLLCVDMGGTSFDLSLIVDGSPTVSTETELEGLPVLMPLVDIHTIGAGGGSIAWLEAGGLRVGPQSAGADPGPACYGRGGTEPTVTDANLFLGRLDPQYFLGGRMRLDADAARRALRPVAAELGLDDTSFAEGVLAIVNANMADAMRTITVKQGIDPRRYALVAFGGAGPMHAAWLADELDISEVVIPWSPGMFSAWGMLQTDMRHDVVRAFYRPLAELDAAEVDAVFEELQREGAELLAEEGIPAADHYFARSADMRYVGQEYSVAVSIGAGPIRLDRIDAGFHDAHRVRYGHSTPGAPDEFVNLRLAAFGRIAGRAAPFQAPEDDAEPRVGTVRAVFDGEPQEAALVRRDLLRPGAKLEGPALVEEQGATTVVPPGFGLAVDPHGNLLITRSR
ncbi:MAG TPA: hydantoinase/oxoprolinase family protein [Gaiellaceae bacterium]|nr:hydantoinase/oxoprolinase family protein [Gaiellaceae bacterium]